MAIPLNNPNNQQQTAVNERRLSNTVNNRPTGRRRHLTTVNRLPDSIIQEEEIPSLLEESNQQQNNNNQQTHSNNSTTSSVCCCCKSQITFCSIHYHRLPDLIVQHQPAVMISADVHFEQQQQSTINVQQMPIDNLALVYSPHWIENDVFLPGPVNQFNMNQFKNQANNQAINQVNNLLNSPQVNQGNKKTNQRNQSNKLDICSPRINIRCQLNSTFYQYNPRLKAKIMLNNARRSASVSLPIDNETLRQVGYSLRMISEQFHLQRLQANALIAKHQQSSNFSYLIKSFCKFLVNKLPSISWKFNSNESNSQAKKDTTNLNLKPSSPIKSKINKFNINQLNINQLNTNQLNNSQLNRNQLDQPDVVPMVHVIIPVRQRCHSTTTDFC